MPTGIELKSLRIELEKRGLSKELVTSLVKEAVELNDARWFNPQKEISNAVLRSKTISAFKAFKHTFVETKYLFLDTANKWEEAVEASQVGTGPSWSNNKARTLRILKNVAIKQRKWSARAAAQRAIEKNGAIQEAVTVAAKEAAKFALVAAGRSDEAADILLQAAEEASRDALFDALGYVNWLVISETPPTKYKENPFRSLIDLWKLGLWPIGVAKVDKQLGFWIAIPPMQNGEMPKLV